MLCTISSQHIEWKSYFVWNIDNLYYCIIKELWSLHFLTIFCSYLQTQVSKLNSCTDDMIKKLDNIAKTSSGYTPIKQLIQEHCLNVITSVSQ